MTFTRKWMNLILSMLCLLLVLSPKLADAQVPSGNDVTFTDISSSWAKDEITYIANLGLINGYENGKFKPDQSLTRAEAVKILVKALDLPLTSASFTDVSSKHWANKYIGAAQKAQIIDGFENGMFHPDQAITRAEAATMLVRTYHLDENKEQTFPDFIDLNIKSWAYPYVHILVSENIAAGYSNNTFKPDNKVTRAEFATFEARILNDDFKVAMKPTSIPVLCWHNFPDNGQQDTLNTDPDRFEEQLAYLKSQGYQTITVSDLLNGVLPPKPIMLTADDGYISVYTEVFPILKELNMKMVSFIIVSSVGRTPGDYPHFTWNQAEEMEASGLVDIESHTYDLHKLVNDEVGKEYLVTLLDGETHEDYVQRITSDLEKSKAEIENHLNKQVNALAYPYGVYNSEVEAIAQQVGFKTMFTTHRGVNDLDALNQLEMKRIDVSGLDTGASIIEKITQY